MIRPSSVTVIGTGIVGLCVAHSLQKAGFHVTMIDQYEPASQCSYGNAGAISASSLAPLAMPGILKQALTMLSDKESPLYVMPRYWLKALPWLYQFARTATPEQINKTAIALQFLLTHAVENHKRLAAEIGCPERILNTGQLHLYTNEQALSKDNAAWALKKKYGIDFNILGESDIRLLEPEISHIYHTGVFIPNDAFVTEPFEYAKAIAEANYQKGVSFIQDKVLHLVPRAEGWDIHGARGQSTADFVVIAAGVASDILLKGLGIHVPLESQRGYHIHVQEPKISISRPIVLTDRKIFISPMETSLRIAGTVEFGGNASPNLERASLLGKHAQLGLPNLHIDSTATTWMGHRPCLPDSLPVIGSVPQFKNLWCAFGHGHLGLTGSVNTGRLITDAMLGKSDLKQLQAFSITRFF